MAWAYMGPWIVRPFLSMLVPLNVALPIYRPCEVFQVLGRMFAVLPLLCRKAPSAVLSVSALYSFLIIVVTPLRKP